MTTSLAVIVPCYNAASTLAETVDSVLAQQAVKHLWLVDDGSTDNTLAIAKAYADQWPDRVTVLRMPTRGGVAMARNWAAMQASESVLAFIDADDTYRPGCLDAVAMAFQALPELGLVRLALHPWGFPSHYLAQPGFADAWRSAEMTVGGNMVVARDVFLAAGGFPQDALFKQLGGEDAALGLALHDMVSVGTLFHEPGVNYRYREGCHLERLLKVNLYGEVPPHVKAEQVAQAEAVTAHIKARLLSLKNRVRSDGPRRFPLEVTRG
jgi:glycosyltransferase involved in cell wall biosynthesis